MHFEQIKSQITGEFTAAYVQSVSRCVNRDQLIYQTKAMFFRCLAAIQPDHPALFKSELPTPNGDEQITKPYDELDQTVLQSLQKLKSAVWEKQQDTSAKLESLNDVRLVQIQSLERLKNLDVQHSSLMQLSIKSLENDIKKLNEEKERYQVIAFEAVKQVEAEIERTVQIIEGKQVIQELHPQPIVSPVEEELNDQATEEDIFVPAEGIKQPIYEMPEIIVAPVVEESIKKQNLITRMSKHSCKAIEYQDVACPSEADLSFNVYLTAIYSNRVNYCLDFKFSDGRRTNFYPPMEEIVIPRADEVRKVVTVHKGAISAILCFELYDKNDQLIFQTPVPQLQNRFNETHMLEEGERIIGLKLRRDTSEPMAINKDFTFIFGKLV